MKITTLILFTTILSIIVNTSQLESTKKSISKILPRPNAQDIQQTYRKTVSPFYEKAYIPQEVDKLTEESNNIKKDLLKFMTKAEIVGPVQQEGVQENPTMYNTVIESHATSITHPIEKPSQIALKYGGGEALFDDKGDLNVSSSEKGFENVIRGSIPVKIMPSFNKQTFSENFEDPVFIHKNEKITGGKDEPVENLSTSLQNQINGDISIIKGKLRIADNKKEKLRVLKDGLTRLDNEANSLSNKIQISMNEILNSKDVLNRLHSVLNNYEDTLRQNEASKLKLVDVIEVKNQLKLKLLKEINGFRTSDNDFQALQKVHPKDLKRIAKKVKTELGLLNN